MQQQGQQEHELLEQHAEYLKVNAELDATRLRELWSEDPRNVFFNLSGHNYQGLEHWLALWEYYRPRLKAVIPWTPFDEVARVEGDVGWVTCSRYTQLQWVCEGSSPFNEDVLLSRSTLIYVRKDGKWRVAHAHFSPMNVMPRPGNI
jgi:ketosteroid isomerase-like protein